MHPEVMPVNDEAEHFAARLLTRTMGHLEAALKRVWHREIANYETSVHSILIDAGLSGAQVRRTAEQLTNAAENMLDRVYHQAATVQRTRVRTDFAVHLIPRLHQAVVYSKESK